MQEAGICDNNSITSKQDIKNIAFAETKIKHQIDEIISNSNR